MVRYNITYPTTLVLHAIAGGARYGFDIADRTGLQTGTVYPALRRLDTLGLRPIQLGEPRRSPAASSAPPAATTRSPRPARDALDVAMKRFENLGRLSPRTRHA